MFLNSSSRPRGPSLLAHHWINPWFYFILLSFILFYFILFLRGLEGGKHIYDSYLLKRQGFLEFKLKQREHWNILCWSEGIGYHSRWDWEVKRNTPTRSIGMGVPLHVLQVNVSVGNWIPENCPNHGQKPFSYFWGFFFFSFNLSRLCWERILWQNSALSRGHCIRGRKVFSLIPQVVFPEVFRRNTW